MNNETLKSVIAEMELFESTKTAPHWQQIKVWKETLKAIAAVGGCTCPSGDGSLRWPCPEHPAQPTIGAEVGK